MKNILASARMGELTAGIIAAGSLAMQPVKAQGPADKPNLLYIVSDEFRRQSMGFWSQPGYAGALNGTSDPVVTPTIDKLASQGIVFTQAMSTQPLSSPYRGMCLTGMFPAQNGIMRNCYSGNNEQLKSTAVCITDVLSADGYATAYFGKTHWQKTEALFDATGNYVGTLAAPGGNYVNGFDTYVPPGPNRHSIQYWYQTLKDSHYDPYCYSNDPAANNGMTDGQLYRPHQYSPFYEANRVVDYLHSVRNIRDTTKPFCIFWSLNPPHMPYAAITDCDSAAYNAYYKTPTLAALLNRPNVTTTLANGNVRFYFSNVTGVDKQMGRVLALLDSMGVTDNTIVVFTSDHGDMMGGHNLMAKNVEYEESFGVPFIIRYPKKLSHRIEKMLLGTTDIMPTLLGLMGLSQKIPASVQGVDYSSVLLDTASTAVKKPVSTPYIYHEGAPTAVDARVGVRTDKYTFAIDSSGNVVSLYNNILDPYQMTKLTFSSLPPADQLMLRTELGSWLAKSNDLWYQTKRLSSFVIYPAVPVIKHRAISEKQFLMKIKTDVFAKSAAIKIHTNVSTQAVARVFAPNGFIVKTVFNGNLAAGDNVLTWDGNNDRNISVVPGIYFVECIMKGHGAIIGKINYLH